MRCCCWLGISVAMTRSMSRQPLCLTSPCFDIADVTRFAGPARFDTRHQRLEIRWHHCPKVRIR